MRSKSRINDLDGALGESAGSTKRSPSRVRRLRPVSPKVARKQLQLCKQIGETLAQVLASQSDDLLRDLDVLEVAPGPDGSGLLVTVAPLFESTPAEALQILQRLADSTGRLSIEIAAAITRKRTPLLIFRLAARACSSPPPAHS